jgi:predicted ABC-type ATPase
VSQPLLLLLAGPNGSGKSTFAERVLLPRTHLPFINADVIAAERWPGEEMSHAYEASRLAAEQRDALIGMRRSFITETVFSHPSKVELIERAQTSGYLVEVHAMLLPLEVTAARVAYRARHGGHDVPAEKIAPRYRRLWSLLAETRSRSDRMYAYDNSSAGAPFRLVAGYAAGNAIGTPLWPVWAPAELAG